MSRIHVANRQIVRPGDLLAEGEAVKGGDYTYRVGDRVYASVLGLASVDNGVVSIIPLEGSPLPREGDIVIGLVTGVGITNWVVDIRAPYKAILNASEALESFNPITDDLRKYIDVGDYELIATFKGDKYYLPCNSDPRIRVVSRPVIELHECPPYLSFVGETYSIGGLVRDINGKPLAKTRIVIEGKEERR